MSTSVFRYPDHLPALHRPEPMREGFAWWRKIHVSYPLLRRKIGGICFEMVRLVEVMVRQIGLMVRSNGQATTQIPIVRRLFPPQYIPRFPPSRLVRRLPSELCCILVALCLRSGI